MKDALTIRHVSHAFGPLKALDDVSLRVGEGELTVLLGVNGAGKTTLFSLITRLYDNVSGEILVCGRNVRREPGPALAELGVVFQTRSLDADLTVAQNLAYHAALHGMSVDAARKRTVDVLAQVDLGDRLHIRVAALSGGQSRRAEIARALMHAPRLLLLDEATVGLDLQSRREVARLIRALAATSGVGVLWATHLFDEIEPSDQVVILHKGAVLAADTARNIADGDLARRFIEITGVERTAM